MTDFLVEILTNLIFLPMAKTWIHIKNSRGLCSVIDLHLDHLIGTIGKLVQVLEWVDHRTRTAGHHLDLHLANMDEVEEDQAAKDLEMNAHYSSMMLDLLREDHHPLAVVVHQ
jgi:hypothetical protein